MLNNSQRSHQHILYCVWSFIIELCDTINYILLVCIGISLFDYVDNLLLVIRTDVFLDDIK